MLWSTCKTGSTPGGKQGMLTRRARSKGPRERRDKAVGGRRLIDTPNLHIRGERAPHSLSLFPPLLTPLHVITLYFFNLRWHWIMQIFTFHTSNADTSTQ